MRRRPEVDATHSNRSFTFLFARPLVVAPPLCSLVHACARNRATRQTSQRDVQNFDTDFTQSACELSPVDEQTLARIDQSLFKKFPYTNPNIFIFEPPKS